MELAIELGSYHLARDPVSGEAYDGLALAYRYSGRLDDSIAAYRKFISLAPTSGWSRTALGMVLLQKGDASAALAEFEQEPVEVFRLSGLTMAYQALGRTAESDAAFEELKRKYPDTKPFQMAAVLTARGDFDGAFAILEHGEQAKDLDMGALPANPNFAALHDDPRWLPMLRRLGIAPEQLAAVEFDVKVPK
jgi:tetratricopeptide (TPR) repeat protein